MAGTMMGVLMPGLLQTLITFQGNLNIGWTRIVVGPPVLRFILLQNVISFVSGRLGAAKKQASAFPEMSADIPKARSQWSVGIAG